MVYGLLDAALRSKQTCGGDQHHGNFAVLDHVSNVRPAFLDLQHNVTVNAVSLQVLASPACTHDAVPQLLQANTLLGLADSLVPDYRQLRSMHSPSHSSEQSDNMQLQSLAGPGYSKANSVM